MAELPPWLVPSYQALHQQFKDHTLAHANLVSEPVGAGAHLVIDRLVREMLDLSLDQDLHETTHPDLSWIDSEFVQEQRTSTRTSVIIDVETIRNVIEYLELTSSTQSFKIVVIDGAHLMNIQASNAFLKVLEEPPNNSFIFLITAHAHDLLPTIRSRCAKISVRRPTESETLEWLVSRDCEKEKAENYLLDFGASPMQIMDAYLADGLIVRECLVEVVRDSLAVPDVAVRFASEDPDSILTRWQSSVVRFAKNTPIQPEIHEYYLSLTDLKRQYTESPALNWRLQYERMLFKWINLYRACRQTHP